MTDRTCTKCGTGKPLADFPPERAGRDGRRAQCRSCVNAAARTRKPGHAVSVVEKLCASCQCTLPAAAFCKASKKRDGLQPWCRSCQQAGRESRRAENHEFFLTRERQYASARRAKPGAVRAQNLRDRYKMTVVQYDALVLAAGGQCGICGGGPDGSGHFHVDHDHKCCPGQRSCGKCVRGALCSRCNWLLGNAGDEIAVLEKAIEYLKRHGREQHE